MDRPGHVTRISDESLPKKILYGELPSPKMVPWWSEEAIPSKPPLKTINRVVGRDCTGLSKGVKLHKKRLLMNTRQKESVKLSRNMLSGKPEPRLHQQSFLPQTSLILSVNMQFRAKIGLISHFRVHLQ